ncbi:MAG: hypothetical protein JRF07_09370 [Deltaproteobacteria bacterium]|jgi:hypothetical protein|nr:hypothetical protein [Deltaproteobacteria bacterium]MBW2476078.1 hypothetical protein [Deltaproteobacteria bacterium]MBW2519720.1 hypothetical protein [Deltaproteobacteria bacterium]
MAILRARRPHDQDPFTDLLFNCLLAFTFLFMVALVALNPPPKEGLIDPKAEYIVTTTWDDFNTDDVDMWVEDPHGNVVWFRKPAIALMHLDRDDRGMENDTIMVNGREIANPLNQEVVTIRGTLPGEYVVNLHYYETKTEQPVTANVRVVKVNPKLEVVFYGNVTLEQKGVEKTAVRFSLSRDGQVKAINTLYKSIVEVKKL